jgi:hypothetical protein
LNVSAREPLFVLQPSKELFVLNTQLFLISKSGITNI